MAELDEWGLGRIAFYLKQIGANLINANGGKHQRKGNEMKKIYLAHPISNSYEAQASIDTANKLRELGYEVYAAAENKSINDKTKDPTPVDIYDADVAAIMDCDIFVVNVTGGYQDGTISEIGVVSGLNESGHRKPIIAYSTNSRLTNPQHHYGIPSAGANHLVLGMIDKWGSFVTGGQDGLIQYMSGDLA